MNYCLSKINDSFIVIVGVNIHIPYFAPLTLFIDIAKNSSTSMTFHIHQDCLAEYFCGTFTHEGKKKVIISRSVTEYKYCDSDQILFNEILDISTNDGWQIGKLKLDTTSCFQNFKNPF